MEKASQRLIIALDDMREEKMEEVMSATFPFATTYKVGLALFVAHGPRIVQAVKARGAEIFLDLKLHDIPMQIGRAVENALAYSPRFLTVHAQGGRAMLVEAAKAAKGSGTKVLAVTMLTSLGQSDIHELGIRASMSEQVARLADIAMSSGVDGLIASPMELLLLRKLTGQSALLICPGIRSSDEEANDQVRTLSAYDAMRQGADAVVVGRPITQAENCLLKAESIHAEITRGTRERDLSL